jgi:hypothetical protein
MTTHRFSKSTLMIRAGSSLILALLFCFLSSTETLGQSRTKLPSAEKIVDNYLKAIGGKKRVAAVRDATYDWTIQVKDQSMGTARTQLKPPAYHRSEMTFGNGQIVTASTAGSAWSIGLDGQFQTLIGSDALVAKLHGLLDASHLVDYRKLSVLARTIASEEINSEPAYTLEFSTRAGARLHYSFSAKTNLLIRITDPKKKTSTSLDDYRAEQGLLEPHRLQLNTGNSGDLTFNLQRVAFNTGLVTSVFDPPASTEDLNITALLREVAKNQDEVEKRVTEYAFTQKETDREISGKGELKKETVKVYEVFPVANREPIEKLISENGVPLSPERAAREEKRVQDEFEKAERDRDKDAQRVERRRQERDKKRAKGGDDANEDPEVSQFLRVCEFVSPRREKFDGREAVVFDFRPRQGFKPSNREESLIAKLVGAVWIDPVDKQVMRLEARLAEGFKMAGGLLLSLRPGAAFVMEQTRMVEGVWLPRYAQINLSVKVLLFGGGDYNKTLEWSDYRHFQGDVSDYKLDAPKVDAMKPEAPRPDAKKKP